MTDTGHVVLTAALLSGIALATFAWRIVRIDVEDPHRLIGELRLAQWASALLAAVGALPIGLAIANPGQPAGGLDVALGSVVVGIAGLTLQRDPREALGWLAAAFVGHALIDLAHRPGWLGTQAAHGYVVGCAVYNVCLAAMCFWTRRH